MKLSAGESVHAQQQMVFFQVSGASKKAQTSSSVRVQKSGMMTSSGLVSLTSYWRVWMALTADPMSKPTFSVVVFSAGMVTLVPLAQRVPLLAEGVEPSRV